MTWEDGDKAAERTPMQMMADAFDGIVAMNHSQVFGAPTLGAIIIGPIKATHYLARKFAADEPIVMGSYTIRAVFAQQAGDGITAEYRYVCIVDRG